ncbi:MAG: DUF1592 domain-containing protein, partial [Myxococcales bacterium]|nr:DUF1592 domain-containing protein [Myxococcales bacterium]
AGTCAEAGPARLWRLSHTQYANTVAELLGERDGLGDDFEPQASGTGFVNGAAVAFVSPLLAEQYRDAAELLAADAVKDLSSLLPCEPADAADRGCVEDFVADFGRRALRRPLTSEQQELYLSLYDTFPGVEGVQAIVEAMLQSPYFVYRFELGSDGEWGERVRAEAHEMASQLAYLLWDSPPDARLLDAAAKGELADPANLGLEVERMLKDPRADELYWRFLAQYFGVDLVPSITKDGELFPGFDEDVRMLLLEEARRFIHHVMTEGTGRVDELLGANYTFLNERLADFYGVDGVSGDDLQRVTLPEAERVGIMTHAGVLSVLGNDFSGSPTLRGKFIRTKLLCGQIPEPPANVNDAIEPPDDVSTTRDRYEAHLVRDDCRGCHAMMDPIGFGLENFDGAGRFRTEENGEPVDVSGEIKGIEGGSVSFEGPRELVEALLSSSELGDCVVNHFFRFAAGRMEESYDGCELEHMHDEFAKSGGDLSALVQVFVNSSAFQYRIKE